MPGSTLDPDNFNLPDRQLGRGMADFAALYPPYGSSAWS
jgi:hypothetical protein